MSSDPAMKPIPDAVLKLHSAAKPLVANHAAPLAETKQDGAANEGQLSSDIRKLCELLAQIMMRRLFKQKGMRNVPTN